MTGYVQNLGQTRSTNMNTETIQKKIHFIISRSR